VIDILLVPERIRREFLFSRPTPPLSVFSRRVCFVSWIPNLSPCALGNDATLSYPDARQSLVTSSFSFSGASFFNPSPPIPLFQ